MKVLIAEDDALIREGLTEILEQEGYHVIAASDGQQALELFHQQQPNFVCLDIMMPKMNGYDVCRAIRKTNDHCPIIFISAKTEEIDKVLGLELGADDYIMKPFGLREVIARVRAVTRRYLKQQTADKQQLIMGDLQLFPNELRASRGNNNIDLSLRDLKILQHLKQHPGQVISKQELFETCWNRPYISESRSLDQHVSQLRKRIEINPAQPKIIQTVHGQGFRFESSY